jgi:hypothetical protein
MNSDAKCLLLSRFDCMQRPQWSTVRWININGMSWDVIKAIAIKYGKYALIA